MNRQANRLSMRSCRRFGRFITILTQTHASVSAGLILMLGVASSARSDDLAAKVAFFETKIRPVLVTHCYECHAADATDVGGGLLVDSEHGLLTGGDSGPAIVAGEPDDSPLLAALRYETVEMPPSGRLSAEVVADFAKWIADGAIDPRKEATNRSVEKKPGLDLEAGRSFWAFQPVGRPTVPPLGWAGRDVVPDGRTVDTAIDAFVESGRRSVGLTPAPETDRRTLLRRLTFDLTGLPPTVDEIDAFVADESPDAYPRLVDRLLGSKQFGVHFGRKWLDVARYADSNGSDFNATFHDAWKYRDYVIAAFNDDKPFDQFVREQIAGDLLPADNDVSRAEGIIATGFLMAGAKMLSERDKDKLSMDVVDEQLNTVGQAFMGLTLGCARCHDHKFDPIPTRDYYAMAGIFRSTRTLQGESQQYVSTWPRRSLPAAPELVEASQRYIQSLAVTDQQLKQAKARRDSLARRRDALQAGDSVIVLDDMTAEIIGVWKQTTHTPGFVGKGYLHDDQKDKGQKRVKFTMIPARSGEYDLQVSYTPGANRAKNVPVVITQSGGVNERHSLDQRPKPPIDDTYAPISRVTLEAGRPVTVIIGTTGTSGYVIVDAVRWIEQADNGAVESSLSAADQRLLESLGPKIEEAAANVTRLEAERAQLTANAPPPAPTAFAVEEAKAIEDCALCIRGEHTNRGPTVPRGVLQVISEPAPPTFHATTSGRLELAEWMADPAHPLTARVYVNRLWHHLIGRGLVASVDNFGVLGDRPTHPELLDHLASELIDSGWSTKAIVRQIVNSRTYRMATTHDEAAWQADPDNQWLWRANRRPLPAEAIRDGLLLIGGTLDLSPGGSPVPGLGVLVTQNTPDSKQYQQQASFRRSVYLPIIRGELPAILTVFDFADPDLVTGQRPITNVPAQALLLLNSPFISQQSVLAAERIRQSVVLTEPATESAETSATDSIPAEPACDPVPLVERAYLLTLARRPSVAERDRAVRFLTEISRAAEPANKKADEADSLALLIATLVASTEFRLLD